MFDVYEKVYQELVLRLGSANLDKHAELLGLDRHNDHVRVPVFGRDYLVSCDGVISADSTDVPMTYRIVLAHYLLYGGSGESSGRFVPYRDLQGGQDFARNLAITVEDRLAKCFSGKVEKFHRSAKLATGIKAEIETSCDGAYSFEALPHLPLMLVFYDKDSDFPAETKLFFDSYALRFLDLECLAGLGMILVYELEKAGET